jgi:endogenous inhibitor of DNA gyrase (YacG/DUF329 family)
MTDSTSSPRTFIASCPICGRPSTDQVRPFCSSRCKEVDLNRWLGGVYRVPGPPAGSPEEDDEAGED